jgi:DNA-binding NarL/FixJ family response regulator
VAVRVLLVDDHEIVRRGLAELLNTEPDIEIVGSVGSIAEAREVLAAETLNVIVLDVRLPDGDGLQLAREIRAAFSSVAVLILTAYSDDACLLEAHDLGAHAFVLKEVRGTDLIRSVRTVANGTRLIDPLDVAAARERLSREGFERVQSLTQRERLVFALIGEGCSNREIGEKLFLAEKTVKNHITSLLVKLGMERRTEVAALAARLDERGRNRSQ